MGVVRLQEGPDFGRRSLVGWRRDLCPSGERERRLVAHRKLIRYEPPSSMPDNCLGATGIGMSPGRLVISKATG